MDIPEGPICFGCANKKGATWPDGHIATTWTGECQVCKKKRAVNCITDWQWGDKDPLKDEREV